MAINGALNIKKKKEFLQFPEKLNFVCNIVVLFTATAHLDGLDMALSVD